MKIYEDDTSFITEREYNKLDEKKKKLFKEYNIEIFYLWKYNTTTVFPQFEIKVVSTATHPFKPLQYVYYRGMFIMDTIEDGQFFNLLKDIKQTTDYQVYMMQYCKTIFGKEKFLKKKEELQPY